MTNTPVTFGIAIIRKYSYQQLTTLQLAKQSYLLLEIILNAS